MTGLFTAAKQILKVTKIKAPARQISAVMVLLAVLAPITAPIPAWAYDLNLPPIPVDDGLRLSAPGASFENSISEMLSRLTGGPAALFKVSGNDKKEAEAGYSVATLEKRVADIKTELSESEEVRVGQKISLAARPIDKKGSIVNGIAAKWQCADPKVVRILSDSEAVAVGEGSTKLAVRSGNTAKEIAVRVTSKLANRSSTVPLMPDVEQPVLTEQQAENLVTPENNLGNPVGQTEMGSSSVAAALRTRERFGSSNYSFDIPAASLPGRGIDASVGITYNSRVWNMSNFGGTKIFSFNTDNNWLSPGFEMSLGEITSFGTASGNGIGYMLTSPDGTRRQLLYKQATGVCSIYESTDGTFIQTTICGIYTTSIINVVFPDGTQVMYGGTTSSGKRFPVSITDRNGNTLTIAYVQNDSQGKILYIRDTLNRYINFHYETGTTDKKLVAISVPGYDGGAERQTIRFYYEDLTLQTTGRFDGDVIAPTTPIKVLRYVYFPGTQAGFRYDYSTYFGMVHKVWQMRGMQVSGSSITETGTVTNEGTWAAWTNYNYPTTPVPTLSDVPKYTERTDDWQGRTSAIPQTGFAIGEDVTPAGCEISTGTCTGTRTVTVTAPDGTRSISVSKIRPAGDWQNGLLDETRVETGAVGSEFVWSKTELIWEQGADSGLPGRDNPRLDKIEVTNDANQTRAISFDYDSYNNQTHVREHDFDDPGDVGPELRRTETIYETGAGWINNRLLRLPKEVKIIVGTETVSKTVYEYDKNGESGTTALTLRADISTNTHNIAFNPSFPTYYTCIPGCTITTYCCHTIQRYNPSTDFRGNVTKITALPDTSKPLTDPGNSIATIKYDILGNVVESSSSCCELKTTQYSNANHYAYPISETRNGQGLQLTTSATYDDPTGLVKTATDENNQTSAVTYNPSNLRVTRTDGPVGTGIWTTTEYNDSVFPYHVKSTGSLDATRSVSSWSFSNGRGQGFRSRSQTTGGYLSSDVEFDVMGRAEKSYNPYTVSGLTTARPAGIKLSEVVTRDGLGRTLQSRLPDMTLVNASYSGLIATLTDQAGKQRRQIADALGRTIRVDEPNAGGLLDVGGVPVQPTYYEYDGNDNLTKVTQSGSGATQERLFKYDSLSRLTHERQVEANVTLDNNGVKIGAGGLWTGVYKYDADSLLQEGTDARGVKTAFTYDGLNRAKTVVYTGETGYNTPNVEYTYDEAETNFYNNGRLTKVKTFANSGQGTPETVQNYRYDKVGQVTKHIQSIGNQSYQLDYGYNLAGQMVSEKYPSGKIVNMTVDNFGRLSTIADSSRTYLSGITINSSGLLSQINLGNGASETFSYNDRFQMTSQSLSRGAEVLQKYDYSYGTVDLANGNVNTAQNNGQLGKIEGTIGTNKQWSQRFGYDELGRLKEAREYKQGTNAQLTYKQVFDFDRFGNLYRKAASNPTAGQQNPLAYTPIEDADISKTTNRFTTGTTYDEAGQVVNDTKFRQMSFAYDANGRQVNSTNSTNSTNAQTVYDALGNRVATKINDVWQYMVYDAMGKLVAEYGTASESLGGVKYVQQDWQGSVRTVTNNNGFVVARTDHQAFGEEIGYGIGQRSVDQGYSVSKVARQGYGLTEMDDATGQQNTPWRKLETRAGRWSSPDPYKGSMSPGNPQSFNRYSYVTNDPVNFVDPSGLCTVINGTTLGPDCFVTINGSPTTVTTGGGGGGLFGGGVFLTEETAGNDGVGGGGEAGGVTPPSGPRRDPNSAECRQLLGKINNIRRDIAEGITDLMAVPNRLEDQPPFLGAPNKQSQQGHRDLLGQYQDNLDRRREEYRKKCGGDPPSSNPARVPVPVPKSAPTPSRDSQRRRDSQGIPVASKVFAGAGAGVVVYVVVKKAAGVGLLFTPAAPVGVVLIATP